MGDLYAQGLAVRAALEGTTVAQFREARQRLAHHALKQCLTCKRVYQLTRGWETSFEQVARDRPRLKLPVKLCRVGQPLYDHLKELEPLMHAELALLRGEG